MSGTQAPAVERRHLLPGMRVAIAVSGGADSVALLRALGEAAPEMGLVLSVAHVHHGMRGAAADEDALFVAELAERMGLAFQLHRVDTPGVARERKQTLEEAARELRYGWFRELLAQNKADAVATAHTLDDQAETVLHRLLRGAWTEGLSGIHPVVACERGMILRPFLGARRAEIEGWLRALGQTWREDATNAETRFTRNRIRHELLPRLAEFNPRIAEQLAHMAALARDEESWWEGELQRLLPSLLLPGRPVRGGGRAVSTHPEEGSVGMELERLRALPAAMRRRVLRAAAKQLGCALNFEQTERLMAMCGGLRVQRDPSPAEMGRPAERRSSWEGPLVTAAREPRRQQLTAELRAERSARELRLILETSAGQKAEMEQHELPIPGEVTGLGVTLRARPLGEPGADLPPAVLRAPKAGDRVKLKHSRGPKPLKEVFERMRVSGEARGSWPVVEWEGRIVWMQGVEVEAEDSFGVEVVK